MIRHIGAAALLATAGAMLVLAFAPFNAWFLAFLVPALLMYAWRGRGPTTCFWRGYAFGLGFFGLGVSWVFNSISEFGEAPLPFAILLTLIFVGVMALFPAIVGWIQARFYSSRSFPVRAIWVIPVVWVLSEWVRSWLFTGFPWLLLGHSQLDTLLAGYFPLGGSLLVSWLVLIIAGAVATLGYLRLKKRMLVVFAITLVVVSGWLLQRAQWTQPQGKPLSVALVQGNIEQQNKWAREWLVPTVERYLALTEKHLSYDLIVWPEVALPGTYQMFSPTVLEPLRKDLIERQSDLITGILYEDGERLYNSLIKIGVDTEIYHKRHLVAFGEYIPFRRWVSWFEDWIVLPNDDVSPGTEPVIFHVKDQRIAGSICFEDAFGPEMADMLPDATLLVNVSNDAWFGDSFAPDQHLQIARVRAAEFARPLLRATNTGITAIVDYHGKLTDIAPQFQVSVLTATVQGRQGATPYTRFENYPLLILLVLVLAAVSFYPNSQQNKL
ncbi:MAG: apolipoprotein N-acyltransferase [Thiotrichales bacterium]